MNIAHQTWIGQLPASWKQTPLRDVLTQRKELNVNREQTNILSVTNDRGVINYKNKGNIGNKASEDIERYKKVYKGDIVANSMNVIIGSVGISPEDGALSPVYIVMKPKNGVDIRYYDYIFKAKGFQAQLRRIGYGILDHRMRIPWDNLKMQSLPFPPASMQNKIADFLDEETAKIDNLIAKQEKLLKLLEEKRRATITNAVTHGLDPKVELKETNIPWLDQIPSHWKIRKLNHLTALLIGSTPSTQNPDDFDGSEVWVTIADMKERIVMDSKQKLTGEAAANKNMKKVPKGSVLFSFKLSVGKVAYCGIDLYTNEAIAAFVPKRDITSEFLYYASQSYFINEAGENIYGAAIFNQELLKAVHIATPPEDEQHIIAKYLDKENIIFNELRDKIMEQILLLKERRTSLISHAVTGKIMV
jgi:type I restriction enzyme S subunit